MLDFATLREANNARLPTFKNRLGAPAHSEKDGSDWDLSAWFTATAGEAGELSDALLDFVLAARINKSLGLMGDLIKKVNRGEVTVDQLRQKLADEGADVVTYLDIMFMRMGIDLGEAVFQKFNTVSQRVGSPIVLELHKFATQDIQAVVIDLRNEEPADLGEDKDHPNS